VSTYRNVPGFEPFKASQSGRSLVDYGDEHQLRARTFADQYGHEWVLVTKWRKDRGWTQITLDPDDRPVFTTFGEREGDAWTLTKAHLDAEGIQIVEQS
jgi:hypothetical protein